MNNLKRICSDIEKEWELSGMTDNLYEDFATQVALRFYYKQLVCGPDFHQDLFI